MDNVLIAQAIAKGKNEKIDEIDNIENNKSKINKTKASYMSYKLFLQYMDTYWLNKQSYDVKFEIQKYHIWSKNVENAYQQL